MHNETAHLKCCSRSFKHPLRIKMLMVMLGVVYYFHPLFFYLHCDLWWCSAQLLCMAAFWECCCLNGRITHAVPLRTWHFILAAKHRPLTCAVFICCWLSITRSSVPLRRQICSKMCVCRMETSFSFKEDRKEIPGLKELKWSVFRGILFCVLVHSFWVSLLQSMFSWKESLHPV